MNNIDNDKYDYEIDLKELVLKIWNKRIVILSISLFITILSVIYFNSKKNIYQVSATFELGEIVNIHNSQTQILQIESIKDLKVIIPIKFKTSNYNIQVIPRTNRILYLKVFSSNKENLNDKIEEIVNFIKTRHDEKVKLYRSTSYRVKNTVLLSVSENPILIKNKSNKKIITVFIIGVFLSIFLILFIEFIKSLKEEKSE